MTGPAIDVAAFAPGIPPGFVRALVDAESRGNPKAENPGSHARGLMQITDGVRRDYNAAHPGAVVTPAELFDPAVNLTIGGWHLRRIVDTYAHAGGALAPAWDSPRWLGLLAFGWNAGWSKAHGVPAVVAELVRAGYAPGSIDADMVRKGALLTPAASRFLLDGKRAAWAQRVADEARRGPLVAEGGGSGFAAFGVGLAIVAGAVLATGRRKGA